MATSISSIDCSCENDFPSLFAQFFEMVPLRRMKWKGGQISSSQLDIETQQHVLRSTVQSEKCKKYPPSLSYRKAFMKKLLHILEDNDVEICDEVYETYTDLLQQVDTGDDTLCYKTYTIDPGTTITLQESVNLISFGTTGLSTWQAAQHLAEWSLENKPIFEGKNVLELGSGLGLTGITVCKQCQVNSYTFTDCNPQVLYLLARNIKHNFYTKNLSCENKKLQKTGSAEESQNDSGVLKQIRRQLSVKLDSVDSGESPESTDSNFTHSDSELLESTNSETFDLCECDEEDGFQNIDLKLPSRFWSRRDDCDMSECKFQPGLRVGTLDWENTDEALVQLLANTDVILAADVVYDTRIIPALVSMLKTFLCPLVPRQEPVCAYVTSTIRYEDTRDQFLITMGTEGLRYEPVDPPAHHLFHYDRSVPIEILKITSANI